MSWWALVTDMASTSTKYDRITLRYIIKHICTLHVLGKLYMYILYSILFILLTE